MTGKLYRSREGDTGAVDSKTQLATLGSETAPGPLLVPAGARKIAAIIATCMSDFGIAADGNVFIRLEGPGLPEGPESLVIGGFGVQVATGAQGNKNAVRIPLDIPVTPSNEILIFAENSGEDMTVINVGVTLEFM
jgi:hypothetical protein